MAVKILTSVEYVIVGRKILGYLLVSTAVFYCCIADAEVNNTDKAGIKIALTYPITQDTLGLAGVSSLDVYREKNVIHVLVAGQSTTSKMATARYLRSDDGGRYWSPAITLEQSIPPPTLARRGNDVQIAATRERILAVWQTAGEFPGMGPIVIAMSSDGGKTWKTGNTPGVGGDQAHMDLGADRQGNFHMVWLDDREEKGYQGLRYARSTDGGQHWEVSVTLDDSTCSCCWNTLGVTPEGQVQVLYRDLKPHDMSLVQSTDGGRHWQHAGSVGDFRWDFDGCPHAGGGLAYVTEDNNTILHSIVWTGYGNNTGLHYLRSDNNGKRWTLSRRIGTDEALHSDITVIDRQHLAAVWDTLSADGGAIYMAASRDNGMTWSTPKRLSQLGTSATHPRIVTTPHGALTIWTEVHPAQAHALALAFIE